MPAATVQPDAVNDHTMQCMEVWGGNREVDNGVVMPGLDAWVYSKPFAGSAGGGDVHYVSSCATGRITRLLLADISGHGQSVAAIGEDLRVLMRRYVNYLDQSRFVAQLNRAFGSIADAGGFATAFAATYWAPTSVLVACNAGHPRPLWYEARTKTWRFLDSGARDDNDRGLSNLPLGVVEPTKFEQFAVRLRRNDLVLLYTDSLIEARNSDGRQLGEHGLLDTARELDVADPHQLMHDLLARVDEYRDGEPDDDVTVLLLRQNGTRPSMGVKDHVRANLAFLGALLSRPFRRRHPVPWPEVRLATWGGAMIPSLNNRWGGEDQHPG